MKTTEEILENIGVVTSPVSGLETYLKANVQQAMLEYGKEVLQLAVEKATCHHISTWNCEPKGIQPEVSKNSILNLINELK
jgi:hypothetical protein